MVLIQQKGIGGVSGVHGIAGGVTGAPGLHRWCSWTLLDPQGGCDGSGGLQGHIGSRQLGLLAMGMGCCCLGCTLAGLPVKTGEVEVGGAGKD